MTTIAVCPKMLAVDSRVTCDETIVGTADKLAVIDGYAIACCGTSDDVLAFQQWFANRKGKRARSYPNLSKGFAAVVVGSSGQWAFWEDHPIPVPVNATYAMGSGFKHALAALKCGKNARQAVEVACKLDVFSGGPVRYVSRSRLKKRGLT